MDLQVLDGIELAGAVNTPDELIIENINHSIRLGHPQVRPQNCQQDNVLLVGGGPSLESTKQELIDLYFQGSKIFALNGGYQWCIDNNLRPSAVIMVDARPNNAYFLKTAIPQCRYLIASQCHASTWAMVGGRDNVWIWHALDGEESIFKGLLDEYYFGHWTGIPGGTTVAMRSLVLLRMLGFNRIDMFGVDSCCLGDKHHAFPQEQNNKDTIFSYIAFPTGHPERARKFMVTNWMLKQLEDFLQLIKVAGNQFLLTVHGNGLLAFALQEAANLEGVINGSTSMENL